MKVSIIVPIYKVEKEIERCLKSLLSQDFEEIELILINDCTPDMSFFLAKEYIENSLFSGAVHFIEHEVNKGLSEARNTGIKIATGDYLLFVDSDDELASPSTISDLMIIAERKNNPDVVMGSHVWVEDDEKKRELYFPETYYNSNPKIYEAYAEGRLWVTAWGKLVLRKIVLEHELYFKEGIYHEDELWSFRLFRVISTLYSTPVLIYKYHDRVDSITSSVTKKNISDLCSVLNEMYDIYSSNPQEKAQSTLVLIEKMRRNILTTIMIYHDKSVLIEVVGFLKTFNLPLLGTRKTSLIRLNILLRLPIFYIKHYLKFKNTKLH